ncbi:hypothetical protein PPYR_11506 [Photinus pyralis]|uniref:Protein krueppel n=1 Tax=Photinus pyralis TaxID=7054 RepID=A0A1Y1K1M3_PHOPY|nr:zinc finger protein OZF-like isoform X1 [Photinus pyralis]KAB0794667.1 hypothetical protein PPYR_11506 [Photinus pyralis]
MSVLQGMLQLLEEKKFFLNYKDFNVTISKFPNMCRTCLKEGENKPIVGTNYEEKSVCDLLQLYTSTKVHLDDGLPQTICRNCLTDLFRMHSFVQKCQQSDVILRYLRDISSKHFAEDEMIKSEKTTDVFSPDQDYSISESRVRVEEERVKVSQRKCKKDLISEKKGSTPYNCSTCKEAFHTYKLLKAHCKLSQHFDIRKHPCTVCAKVFTNSKLKQHMRAHTKERPYKCKICLRGFSMSGNLKRHMMTHTGERPHVCEVCGKGFIQSTTLHNHKKTHIKGEIIEGDSNYICSHCGRGFKRLTRYNTHLLKHNSKIVNNQKSIMEQSANFECTFCKRTYKTKHLLKAHQLTHGEKSFLCSDCGKGFVTKAALQSHLKVHTGEKPYTCNICSKSFAHVASFEAHLLIHTGQKPYNCDICKKAFTQLSHLKYHMRTHSGERPYICQYCSKSFALKGNLTVHVRTHTGETPHVCPICERGFYDSSSMKKHKRRHVENGLVKVSFSSASTVNSETDNVTNVTYNSI